MGSGKTTVGPLLAARLGWSFIDVDDMIEAEACMTIAEIFARHGEAAFREREHATITRLAASDSLVLALGGGAIENEATRSLLLTSPGTLLVHLEVELATTLKRCQGTEQTRPILADQANLASSLPASLAALPHGPRNDSRRRAHTAAGCGSNPRSAARPCH